MPNAIVENVKDEVPKAQKINLAVAAYLEVAEGSRPSIRSIARSYGVQESTVRRRIRGAKPRTEKDISSQLLTPDEEASLVQWITQMEDWGWPARVSQLRSIASNMIREKNTTFKQLGKNWPQAFVRRHPELTTTRWTGPTEGQSTVAQSRETGKTHQVPKIWAENVNNMGEEGAVLEVQGRCKVFCTKNALAKLAQVPNP